MNMDLKERERFKEIEYIQCENAENLLLTLHAQKSGINYYIGFG
jgi:hypothetical protein